MDDRELTADLIDVVTEIWKKYQSMDIITRKFGIPKNVIRKYVKFARLPKLLQDNLSAFHKNPKTAMNVALDAVDVLDYEPTGKVKVKKVFDLAKKLGKAKKVSNFSYRKLKQAAEKNPNKSLKEIEKIAGKIRPPIKYKILFEDGTKEYETFSNGKIGAIKSYIRSKKLRAILNPKKAKKYKALVRKLKQAAKERGGKPEDYLKEFLWMASNKINQKNDKHYRYYIHRQK